MQTPPLIALLGAPHTDAPALAKALQAHLGIHGARVLCLTPGTAAANHLPDDTDFATLRSTASHTLLMGLDLPCPADARLAQEAADLHLRAALGNARVVFKVVYGKGEQRLISALIAIQSIAPDAYPTGARGLFGLKNEKPEARRSAWNCEKCSDPECEHRLFTRLTGARPAP